MRRENTRSSAPPLAPARSFTANRPNYGTVQSFAGSLMMTDSVFAGNVASLQNMVYSGFVAQDSFL